MIAVSTKTAEDILSAYPNLDPDKVVVVHNGITMSQFETPSDDDPGWKVFERYNIDRNKPTLLFVRTYHPAEGPAIPASGVAFRRSGGHPDRAVRGRPTSGDHERGQNRVRQA